MFILVFSGLSVFFVVAVMVVEVVATSPFELASIHSQLPICSFLLRLWQQKQNPQPCKLRKLRVISTEHWKNFWVPMMTQYTLSSQTEINLFLPIYLGKLMGLFQFSLGPFKGWRIDQSRFFGGKKLRAIEAKFWHLEIDSGSWGIRSVEAREMKW